MNKKEPLETLRMLIPNISEEHREMFKKLHQISSIADDYIIDVCPAYRLIDIRAKPNSKMATRGFSFNQLEYCYFILPKILPNNESKYGYNEAEHYRAKMNEYIRNGKHPVEYLYKKFIH